MVVYARGMECEIGTNAKAKELVAAALTGRLTEVQSKELAALGPEVVSLARRGPAAGLLHHSDRGVQYACDDYQGLLSSHGIEVSMSGRGGK